MNDRRRNTPRAPDRSPAWSLASLVVIVGVPVAVIGKKTRLGLDLKGGVQLIYQGKADRAGESRRRIAERAIDIMRKRVDQLGVAQPEIQRSGDRRNRRRAARSQQRRAAEQEVGKTAQLLLLRLGAERDRAERQAGADRTTVTGGANAGAARVRAARVPGRPARRQAAADPAQERHHLAAGLHARRRSTGASTAAGTCSTPSTNRCCASGTARTPQTNLLRRRLQAAAGRKPKAVRVNPGTVLVQAPTSERSRRQGRATTAQQLVRAQRRPGAQRQRHHQPAAELRRSAGAGQPNVTFGFTGHGQKVFEQVTKEIAQRGQEAQLPGVSKERLQHFAVVLDGQLITTPSIDYTKYPEGIDATNGSEISGGFTLSSAQNSPTSCSRARCRSG